MGAIGWPWLLLGPLALKWPSMYCNGVSVSGKFCANLLSANLVSGRPLQCFALCHLFLNVYQNLGKINLLIKLVKSFFLILLSQAFSIFLCIFTRKLCEDKYKNLDHSQKIKWLFFSFLPPTHHTHTHTHTRFFLQNFNRIFFFILEYFRQYNSTFLQICENILGNANHFKSYLHTLLAVSGRKKVPINSMHRRKKILT